MSRLTAKQVQSKLASRPEWTQSGDVIQRTFGFPDFISAMAFVNQAAQEAERVQHHPDIMVRYSKVTLALSTHDAGGITQKDFDFAAAADGLYGGAAKGGKK
jgi:4a-hydroxytetrahydrobiopterin dehydratase